MSSEFDNLELLADMESNLKEKFSKIYGSVISNYFVFNGNMISDTKAILKSQNKGLNCKSSLPSYQLAFLLSFSVQDSCLSVQKFYESIMDCPKIIEISENNQLKMFCVDIESLPTAIGVCHVIDEFVEKFGKSLSSHCTNIKLTIIDNRGKLKGLAECIVDTVNSYFNKIEIELEFKENFVLLPRQEFNNRIEEIDIMVVARAFTKNIVFNYNVFFQKTLAYKSEMKKNAILFYIDCCNEEYYKDLEKWIVKKKSFSKVKSCEYIHASFENLEDEQQYLDLPINWDTDFQPIMFSTWIKDVVPMKALEKNQTKATEHFNKADRSSKYTEKDVYNLIQTLPVTNKRNPSSAKKKEATPKKASQKSCKVSQSSQNPQSLKVSSDVAASQKVMSESLNKVKSAKGDSCENSSLSKAQEQRQKQKKKADTLKIYSEKQIKVIPIQDLELPSKQEESKKVSDLTTTTKKENEGKSHEKSKEKCQPTASKVKRETKPSSKNVPLPVFQKTKKLAPPQKNKREVKNCSTANIKLTGKFACMDLEKKNKDERHKMRAKQKSFSKYADYDYDD